MGAQDKTVDQALRGLAKAIEQSMYSGPFVPWHAKGLLRVLGKFGIRSAQQCFSNDLLSFEGLAGLRWQTDGGK